MLFFQLAYLLRLCYNGDTYKKTRRDMQAINRKWYGDRMWYLLNLKPVEVRAVFSDQTPSNLKKKRTLFNKLYRQGEGTYPDRPKDYDPLDTPEMIRSRLDKQDHNEANIAEVLISQQARSEYHRLLDDAISQANIDPTRVKGFSIQAGHHTGYIKNKDDEIEYTKELPKQSIKISVEPRSFEPQWDIVSIPVGDIHPIKSVKRDRPESQKRCVILPDPQIGYRKFRDGTLDPFHDNAAISVAMQVVADLQPDKIVWLGDYLDLPMFGRFEQSEEYAQTAQLAVNYGYKLLAKLRATCPKAEIVVIEGNHDRRIEKSLQMNTLAAFGLRQAELGGLKEFPAFSVPHLLRFNDLDVKYVEGYPAGRYWINDRLQCIHGHLVRPAGATAAAVVKDEHTSTVFGHIHRIEQAYLTHNVHDGAKARIAHSPGCLCRIDGAVPSAKGSTDLNGAPLKNWENWQQGLSVVNYEDGDGFFNLESIYINTLENHRTVYAGKVYEPVDIEGLEPVS